jgi:hypothetical protein
MSRLFGERTLAVCGWYGFLGGRAGNPRGCVAGAAWQLGPGLEGQDLVGGRSVGEGKGDCGGTTKLTTATKGRVPHGPAAGSR